MRYALLSCIGWLGALQSWGPPTIGVDGFLRILAIASVLGTLTVLIYRLGVWRQEMENTKQNVVGEVKGHREESAANFTHLERRLDAIDHLLTQVSDDRARVTRWRARTEHRLDRLEQPDVPGAEVDE